MTTTKPWRILFAGLCAAGITAAHALDLRPDGVSLEAGASRHGTGFAGAGLVWDWDFQRMRRKAELSAHTEVLVNHWRADALTGGNQGYTQIVLLPSLRMRLARGASPWFIELGIGASYLDRTFEVAEKRFGSRWNFYDMMGLGHSFGPDREHELVLRWVHVSNAGLKQPNPGQDFLQLRYVARF